MTKPTNYLIRMILFCVVIYGGAVALSPVLAHFFMANPVVNSVIFVVEIFGVVWNIRQVQKLYPELAWVEDFRRNRPKLVESPPPALLAPMARMLHGRADGERRITLSGQSMRTILDGVSTRLDESRELSRYTTGVMIFLGLLGTFWGLLHTVSSVAAVINGMNLVGGGDVNAMFEQLKIGLSKPLAGMGTAFSSSMFGLSGALILGFLDLTAGQAMNRFFNELEEWLASLTRLGTGALAGDGEASVPAYVQALLEQTAENMDQLQRVLTRGEESRVQGNNALRALADRMADLGDTLRLQQQLMEKVASAQISLSPLLSKLSDGKSNADDVARAHLRNIELLLNRFITESEQGRSQNISDLRSDLKILTRTVSARLDESRNHE
ncbi:flagellar motor protein MotA [Acidocella sp.]|uniref:flagellar motor protein MotA n=1 Tax=Acidocella sp. TaxID=50710 RepID=UPI003D02EDE1